MHPSVLPTSLEWGLNIQDKNPASIRLEFFRHSKKTPSQEWQDDYRDVRLTEEGRVMARESGKKRKINRHQALGFSSGRDRAEETVWQQLYSSEYDLTNLTLDDIRETVDSILKYWSRVGVDKKLDFFLEWQILERWLPRYTNSKDFLSFLLEESDDIITETQEKDTSYSRAAANIAMIIKKYIKILPRWQRLRNEKSDKYPEEELQRLFGSHGGYVECFLLKVIEKKYWKKFVMDFIKSHTNGNDFSFNEGYSIQITGEEIILVYKDLSFSVTRAQIDEIIHEGESF